MREYYLDELFNMNISFPTSISEKEFRKTIYENDFDNDDGEWS